MKILVDMNLSPSWCPVLTAHGWPTIHWAEVGHAGAIDCEIMRWAKENGYVVFTNDLDFSAILAATNARGPSILQVRTQDVLPASLGPRLIQVLEQHQSSLEQGAIVVVDEARSRVRILPIVQAEKRPE
jgi:predicted nuclease of predicted toxin-antitoxin system